ncbi:hypothetical protein [Methyloferula stellata]|uniref:hypothetical protein n=1 Tax=Methyloferula stellata TaxID=876270 RepID=UPI00036A3211|nr:hypothetical protein [Methyloferula stellata]
MSFARPRHHLRIVPKPETDPLVEAARETARFWASRQSYSSATMRSIVFALVKLIDARGYAVYRRRELAAKVLCSQATVDRYLRDLASAGLLHRAGQSKNGQRGFAQPAVVILYNDLARDFAAGLGWPDSGFSGQKKPLSVAQRAPHKTTLNVAQNALHTVAQNAPHSSPEKSEKSVSYTTRPEASRACSNNIDIYKQSFEHVTAAETSKPASADYSNDLDAASFEDFQSIWPWQAGEPLKPARRAFQRLSLADRLLAIRGVHAFAAAHRNSKRGAGKAVSYLKDHKWEVAQTANPGGSQVFIPEGSRRHALWSAASRREGRAAPYLIDSREHRMRGFYRATPLPPAFMHVDFPSARKVSKELFMSSTNLPTAANDDFVKRLFASAPKSNPPTPYEIELGHGLPTNEAELAQAIAEGRAQPAEPPPQLRAAFDSIPVVDTDLSLAELAARAVTRR